MIGERMLSTGQAAKRFGVSVPRICRRGLVGRLVPITRWQSTQRRFVSRQVDASYESLVTFRSASVVCARKPRLSYPYSVVLPFGPSWRVDTTA